MLVWQACYILSHHPTPQNLTLLNLHVSGFYKIYVTFMERLVGNVYPKLVPCVTVVHDN